jgi:2-aminoethylphosphonate dioxygenase
MITKNKIYNKNGYLRFKKEINNNLISKIKSELINLKFDNIYTDKKGKIRRIENIYNKTENLKKLNKILTDKILEIFGEKLVIFKDKCNFKPSGGAGFTAHYDGVFYFKDKKNKKRKGWFEYSSFFINVLVALDKCNSKNGTLEIAKWHNKSFDELLINTKNNGSPELKKSFEKKLNFKKINLSPGDLLFFSNKCPHRSKKNFSSSSRMLLYYTYAKAKKNVYNKYFYDKSTSKNKNSKSLTG